MSDSEHVLEDWNDTIDSVYIVPFLLEKKEWKEAKRIEVTWRFRSIFRTSFCLLLIVVYISSYSFLCSESKIARILKTKKFSIHSTIFFFRLIETFKVSFIQGFSLKLSWRSRYSSKKDSVVSREQLQLSNFYSSISEPGSWQCPLFDVVSTLYQASLSCRLMERVTTFLLAAQYFGGIGMNSRECPKREADRVISDRRRNRVTV